MSNKQIGTLEDFKERGYVPGEVRLSRGYRSRKNFANIKDYEIPVYSASGTRKGQVYYEMPNYMSTSYHYRVYLVNLRAANERRGIK